MARLLPVIVVVVLLQLSCVDGQTEFVNGYCTIETGNYTQGSAYQQNLNLLFSRLKSQAPLVKFYNFTTGEFPNVLYGLYQCRQDLSLEVCSSCITDATQKIVEACPLRREAIVWYYECTLRYANYSMFSSFETAPGAQRWKYNNVSDYTKFALVLAYTMKDIISQAAVSTPSGHFAIKEANLTLFSTLYSLAQCTSDIDELGCRKCLTQALNDMIDCCNGTIEAMVFFPSCQLRYDTTSHFYNLTYLAPALAPPSNPSAEFPPGSPPAPPSPPGPRSTVIAGIAVAATVGLLLLVAGSWLCLRRKKFKEVPRVIPPAAQEKMNQDNTETNDGDSDLGGVEFVQYDFATLKAATEDFSLNNKLGEGGFGIVYKGTLKDRQKVAIKRLSGNSGQGAKEFMTEARFVAKLQHRNLVKLIGFCSERDEKLLVYEFMPNTSLDRFLFGSDPRMRAFLDWDTRYKIIMGITRGLLYLHEDSRLTIIHRDLKASNILLDKEMNPKIADFGTAKLFGTGQIHGKTTRIVGTHGYMAPEYLITGEYSDKSDVYSFGIIILEIVSGQMSRTFDQSPQKADLPVHAWTMWNKGRSVELIDPVLYNKCSINEVMRCIQIGLLCVQASAEHRPSMAAIVVMLTSSVPLPQPPMPTISHDGQRQSVFDHSATKSSFSWHTDMEQDLYPR